MGKIICLFCCKTLRKDLANIIHDWLALFENTRDRIQRCQRGTRSKQKT
jgi:hypothetical protein